MMPVVKLLCDQAAAGLWWKNIAMRMDAMLANSMCGLTMLIADLIVEIIKLVSDSPIA